MSCLFFSLNDDRIRLDSSKTSSTGFSSLSSDNDHEANVSDADSQRILQVGERKFPLLKPCQMVLLVFYCTLEFLEGSE
jgi:hypothetical protein